MAALRRQLRICGVLLMLMLIIGFILTVLIFPESLSVLHITDVAFNINETKITWKLINLVNNSALQNSSIASPESETANDLGERTTEDLRKCPDQLAGMTKGRWVQRPLTLEEQNKIDAYLRAERGYYHIPPTYQRVDGRCGDVPYDGVPLYNHMWFKAICDPKGSTPCCRENRCVASQKRDCQCPACADERQAVHAEFAQWTPTDDRCRVPSFSQPEICQLLRGWTVHFVGDSFVRHVFATLVVLLTNMVDGALKKDTPPHMRAQCTGWFQVTGAECRNYLEQEQTLCNGTVRVSYTQVFLSKESPLAAPLLHSLRHMTKSIMVLGLGIHDNFDLVSVTKKFLLPFLNLHQHVNVNKSSVVELEHVLTNFTNFNVNTLMFNQETKNRSNKNDTIVELTKYQLLEPLIEHQYSLKTQDIIAHKPSYSSLPFTQQNNKKELNVHQILRRINKRNINLLNLSRLNSLPTDNTSNSNTSIEEGRTENKTFVNPPSSNLLDFRGFIQETAGSNTFDKSFNPAQTTQSQSSQEIDNLTIFQALPKFQLQGRPWPHLLWVGIHAPGLLKSPKFKEQTSDGVQRFNSGVFNILRQWGVPYLDTFTFSNGTVSFDGTHYGWGVNVLKVNMIVKFLQQEYEGESGVD